MYIPLKPPVCSVKWKRRSRQNRRRRSPGCLKGSSVGGRHLGGFILCVNSDRKFAAVLKWDLSAVEFLNATGKVFWQICAPEIKTFKVFPGRSDLRWNFSSSLSACSVAVCSVYYCVVAASALMVVCSFSVRTSQWLQPVVHHRILHPSAGSDWCCWDPMQRISNVNDPHLQHVMVDK